MCAVIGGWSAAAFANGSAVAQGKVQAAPSTAAGVRPPPFPATLADKKAAEAAAGKPAPGWSASEVTIARAKCAEILNRIAAIAIPQAPLREGACGAPAPVKLISIGRDPEVIISPPATVTCELADKLAAWLDNDLQPLARKHLGSRIMKIENMSSYSCRNVYGRKNGRLSQHGLASALDIRGFVTESAERTTVLADWGTTGREIRARIAAERAIKEKRLAEERAAAERATAQADATSQEAAASTAPALPTFRMILPSPMSGAETEATLSFGAPNKLGGPKLDAPGLAEPAASRKQVVISVIPGPAVSKPTGPKSAFLRAAHAAACKRFGTTLGPELNKAHRNHLHIDVAPRKIRNICD